MILPRLKWPMIAAAIVILGQMIIMPTPAQASDTATRWEHFSEASACGWPYTKPPYMSGSGAVSWSEPVLGPYGTYFGRTVSQVSSRLVWWTVPGSGGRRVRVQAAALPAFNKVSAGLATEASHGRVYPITSVSGFTARTVNGSRQLSRHALGIAVDINYSRNPYRADGKLTTNMPKWFVDIWRNAGFCWGGDWESAKDPMHFSWMGPGAGTAATSPLNPIAPRTALRPFGAADLTLATLFGGVLDRYSMVIADGTGNGAPDVVGIRSHPNGSVIDIASATQTYGSCSIGRWFVPDSLFAGADHTILMDTNGDSRQDLVTLRVVQGGVEVRVATRKGEFEDGIAITLPLPGDIAAVTGADFDGDHYADLWVATADGTLQILAGPDWVDTIQSGSLPSGAPRMIAAADRDGGDTPELFALYQGGSGPNVEVLGFASGWGLDDSFQLPGGISDYVALGAGDFDGEGRADLLTLDSAGRLAVYLGNTASGRPATSWFVNPSPDCTNPIPLSFDGRFYDDETSVHINGIEALAAAGITTGCNPPFNDRFCPRDILTRAQAATFVARVLQLPPATEDYFTDDDGHVLEGAINRIAAAGITTGCNPPLNTEFCPDRSLTRAEFATFIARALSLPDTATDYFTDDDGHILEGAINRIAAAGITTGCNPPLNTEFCPQRYNTRAEAATFMTRAFHLN